MLGAGNVLEFDERQKLLNNKNSTFYNMAKDAGLVT